MLELEVRDALAAEFASIGELTARTYLTEGFANEDYAETLRDVATRAAEVMVLVALVDGQLAGSVTVVTRGGRYAEGHDPGTAVIRMLVTDPAFRGAGVGTALVAEALHRARADHCRGVQLSTMASMHAAHRLYERFGFTRTPELDWWPIPDLLLLTYALTLAH